LMLVSQKKQKRASTVKNHSVLRPAVRRRSDDFSFRLRG